MTHFFLSVYEITAFFLQINQCLVLKIINTDRYTLLKIYEAFYLKYNLNKKSFIFDFIIIRFVYTNLLSNEIFI